MGAPYKCRTHGETSEVYAWKDERRCKMCRSAWIRQASSRQTPEQRARRATYQREWEKRRSVLGLSGKYEGHLRRKYGITVTDYRTMLTGQRGQCALCPSLEGDQAAKKFDVDHDHVSGRVRGLLCRRCNSGIGYYERAPHAAIIKYLGGLGE